MKKHYPIIIFLLALAINAQAGNLRAYLSYSTFYSINDGPFIETYISVEGSSVVFIKNENGKYQGTIEITLMFREEEKIRDFKKYELYSPEIEDTNNVNFNFIDQQRFVLPQGNYTLVLLISDKHSKTKAFTIERPVTIYYPEEKVAISGIELIDYYYKTTKENILTKSGYDLVPYLFNYFPESRNEIIFYAEVYNTEDILGKDEKFVKVKGVCPLLYFFHHFL